MRKKQTRSGSDRPESTCGERPYVTDYEAGRINTAVEDAVTRHPVFCHAVSSMSADEIADTLPGIRREADSRGTADAVILEELLETLEAYRAGDYRAAVEDAYQLVATTVRMARHITHEAYNEGAFK